MVSIPAILWTTKNCDRRGPRIVYVPGFSTLKLTKHTGSDMTLESRVYSLRPYQEFKTHLLWCWSPLAWTLAGRVMEEFQDFSYKINNHEGDEVNLAMQFYKFFRKKKETWEPSDCVCTWKNLTTWTRAEATSDSLMKSGRNQFPCPSPPFPTILPRSQTILFPPTNIPQNWSQDEFQTPSCKPLKSNNLL